MPRPGPRPYECVRRAWHSDRHQPIRGSLIQEIFRVVNESHRSSTKKNKEWQEKLPIVVLKAEEIMYSKANSEAEYMDLQKLWDRTTDAINTIIRRDESTETGELIQPCIEAALILGCTPRRASRSQRNSDPRYYLCPTTQAPSYIPPRNLENITKENHVTISPYMSHCLNFVKPPTLNITHAGSESLISVDLNNNCTSNKFPFASENVPISSNNQCSVYPLCYGFEILPKSNSYTLEPTKMKTNIGNILENPCEIECDLSLRLGPLSVPCQSVENIYPQGVEDTGSDTSREGSKFTCLSPQRDKRIHFLSWGKFE